MTSEKVPLLSLPYAERQRIIVVKDSIAKAGKAVEEAGAKKYVDLATTGAGAAAATLAGSLLLGPAVPVAAALLGAGGIHIIRQMRSAKDQLGDQRGKVQIVSRSEAKELTFLPGHPREKVLYIGHPLIANVYYPTAHFHRLTFLHKFDEAVRLLMSLGATDIHVEHNEGWSKELDASLGISASALVQGGKVDSKIGYSRKSDSHALFKATYRKGSEKPSLPRDMVWYPSEPTWQLVADGRMKHGLETFSLVVKYNDDFGINASLGAKAVKLGFDLGGSFESHQCTKWHIVGAFDASQ